jgi:Xaa-Pro aminopeptidase
MADIESPGTTGAALIRHRLAAARARLRQLGGEACLVLSADPHMSEDLPDHWRGRAWLSGFDGQAGTLAFTADRAALFTDSRYWERAEAELAGTGVELVRTGATNRAAHIDWLIANTAAGGRVLTDGACLSVLEGEALDQKLAQAGLSLIPGPDLLDGVWTDRPARPAGPIHAHPEPWRAAPRNERLARVRARMKELGATHHLISALEDIAWLTTLRGHDIRFNPLFVAHLLLTPEATLLFAGAGRMAAGLEAELAADGVEVHPYEALAEQIAALPDGASLLLDPARTALSFFRAVPAGCITLQKTAPSTLLKIRKSPAEIDGFRATAEADGAALCRFQARFAQSVEAGEPWDEWKVHERLTEERARHELFRGPAFLTIAGFNANGALPHHAPSRHNPAPIRGDGMLLIDSGGQYLSGTTDVTRVWAVGEPPAEARRAATLALRGLIAYSAARFPHGIRAPMLDALARGPLWAEGLDYGHGTGHGIGHHLPVHELPPLLSGPADSPDNALLPGMVIAVEPGAYRSGHWGVRWENNLLCIEAGEMDHGGFLEFETLTLCPIDRRCLLTDLLSAAERGWVDAYHARVRARLSPLLDDGSRAWLHHQTEPLAA